MSLLVALLRVVELAEGPGFLRMKGKVVSSTPGGDMEIPEQASLMS